MNTPATRSAKRTGMKAFVAGSLVSQISALLRYVILARILGPDQLGLAAILILTSSFLELVTEGGISTYLVQSDDGEDPKVQAMVQLVNVVRCAVMAAALFALAEPLAWFYARPELADGVRWLALSPMILAFLHYDVKRVQRSHDFGPEGWMMIASEIVALAAAILFALITQSFYAVAFGLAGRSLAMAAVSHFSAQRPFRLAFAAKSWGSLRSYSWPLILDGLILFIGQQGDRVLIGKLLGVQELGLYAALLLLIYYPTGLINKLLVGLHLPQVVQGLRSADPDDVSVDVLGGHYLITGLLMLFGFCATMPVIVPFLFGHRFAVSAYSVALVGLLQVSRYIRGWPTVLALAMSRSRQVLANNILRLICFPLAVIGHLAIGGLQGILIGFSAGEILSLALATFLVDWTGGRAAVGDLFDIALTTGAGIALCCAGYLLSRDDLAAGALLWAAAIAAGTMVCWRRRLALGQVLPLLKRIRPGARR